MSLSGEIKRRIQMLFHRGQLSRDLEEEMRLHLDLRRQQQIDRGLTAPAAIRAAHLKFGNTTRIKEKSLMTWGSETLESFFADVAYGNRPALIIATHPAWLPDGQKIEDLFAMLAGYGYRIVASETMRYKETDFGDYLCVAE